VVKGLNLRNGDGGPAGQVSTIIVVARWCAVIVFGAFGLALLVGGTMLAHAGGSFYYVLSAVPILVTAVDVARGNPRSRAIFAAWLVITVAWSLWEVGFAGWLLVPRLGVPIVLGLLLLLPIVRRRAPASETSARYHGVAIAGLLVVAGAAGSVLHGTDLADPDTPWLRRGVQASAPSRLPTPIVASDRTDWGAFGNDQGGTRFSPLDQINTENVTDLKPVWSAETGPMSPGPKNGLETVPIMIGDTLYACSGFNQIVAIDAEDGTRRWIHDMSGGVPASGKPCRGVSYYRLPNGAGHCAERILAASQTPALVAVDAHTGKSCDGFGTHGVVDLNANISKYPRGQFYVSSAPQVIHGKIVVGGGIPDGQFWGGPSGVIRAFDAVSGQLAWAFDAGQPQRIGAPPAGQVYTPSSPNSWAPISADEQLGMVYLPVGGATPDNYGAQRRTFDDAYGDTVLALDADTGRVRWKFQTTHHDIWDYDVPAQPTLVELPTSGGVRHALIQATKRGEVFVLDRTNGKPIFPVQEQAVVQGGTAPGERLSPTQPASTGMPAFRGPTLREKDMWGISPVDQMLCRIAFRGSRYQGHLTPSSLDKPTLFTPGSAGGVNWGGVSIDAYHGIMVVTWMQTADRVEILTRAEAIERKFKLADGRGPGGDAERPMLNTPYASYGKPFLSPLGVPCNAPPWGLIGAVDLATGKLLWHAPLGSARDSGPLGIPSMLPLTIGTPLTGGSVATRGGLIFVAAAAEKTLRAFDVRTGRELWAGRLPASGNASPITYLGPRSGRQFVVIAAGGNKSMKTKLGNHIVAFALPRVTH
jgi:quinoprotein glucose dehydrogenase